MTSGHDGSAPRGPALGGRRILIVEDIYLVADDLSRIVRRHGGQVVGPVPDVIRARTMAVDERLDLAILDIDLRGEDVFGVAEILERRGIPFVFVTGYGRTHLPCAFRATPFVSKPFSEADLLERAARALRPPDRRGPPPG